jgi:hypothetical protein
MKKDSEGTVIVFIFLYYARREKPFVDEIIILRPQEHMYYAYTTQRK